MLYQYIQNLSARLFNELKNNEELNLLLHSEESDFLRFNHAQVRQNTTVQQHELLMVYQIPQRNYKKTMTLSLDLEKDFASLKNTIESLRNFLPQIEENPKVVSFENHGISKVIKTTDRPPTAEILPVITKAFAKSDMVGFWASGPIRKASLNSKGQFHYFENDTFFFDYSVYNGPRAAKGFYSEDSWHEPRFLSQAQQTQNTLALLTRPQIQVKPNAYRVYLEPMAVAEIMGIFNWRAVSRGSYEQGFAPLKKLVQKEKLFSPLFTLIEDNQLGLDTHFNSIGEIPANQTTLIENGEFRQFLTSTATAQEYKVLSNQADPSESMRSFEVRAGTLNQNDVLKKLDHGLYISNLHYINWSDVQTARITGMTRFACFWVEKGEIVGPIQDLRFDDSLFNLFGPSLVELAAQSETFMSTSTYYKRQTGGMKVPGALISQFNFTL